MCILLSQVKKKYRCRHKLMYHPLQCKTIKANKTKQGVWSWQTLVWVLTPWADSRVLPQHLVCNKAFVVQTDGGRSRITPALYHPEAPQAFHVCGDQPKPWTENLYLSWSPVANMRPAERWRICKASYWRGSTHSNWKKESFGSATETLVL